MGPYTEHTNKTPCNTYLAYDTDLIYKISSFELFRMKLEHWRRGERTEEHVPVGVKPLSADKQSTVREGWYVSPSAANAALQLNFYRNW